ncbi:TIGR02302 family protein [Aliiroseovarius sp. 2305UL8-7]|uniref:TIGR02302 family protein n=1 Tax=Aliiroseovarius conchicola TaxID=3121637 RepID=UPI0035280BDE
MTRQNLPDEVQSHLKWPLRLTGAGLVLERLWLAFWPLVSVLLATFAIWSFWAWTVPQGLLGFILIASFAALAALIWGARRLEWPRETDRVSRLDNSLSGHPIATLMDEQGAGRENDASRSLWDAHRHRMSQRIKGVKPIPPDLKVARSDPYALRLIAATGAALALFFTPWIELASGKGVAIATQAQTIATTSWEGWIEPPGYTGRPSLYLSDQPAGALSVPIGSRLTLRLYGDLDALSVTADLSDTPIPDQSQQSYLQIITRDGPLKIDGPGGASWDITAIGDTPPTVTTKGDLTRWLSGDFSLEFSATDDYAVTLGAAELALDLDRVDRRYGLATDPEPRDTITVDLPLPFLGPRTDVEGILEENLIEHPWAGLPVDLTLKVEDGAGQTGTAPARAIVLPARRFLHPVAKALIEQRRDLLWSRENGKRTGQLLRTVLNRPDELELPSGTYLRLRGGIRQLELGISQSQLPTSIRDEIAILLWDIAVELEDGQLGDALERMQQAQERLEQAMRDGATAEELAELMQEFRDAMRDYMEQLAQNQENAPPSDQQQSENTIEMSQADLDAMMDRIEELMREGREDEAMQMLDQMRQMMENMQMAQNGSSNQPGDEARQGLQDTLRQQQGLSDQAFRDLQEEGQGNQAGESQGNEGRDGGQGRGQSHDGAGGQEGQNGQGEGDDQQGGQQGGAGPGDDLAGQQRTLQQQLDAQRRNLPGAGDEAGQAAREALDDAGRAMGDAADALEQGDLPEALGRQADAMEALREGLRQFDEAMQSQQAQREGEQGSSPGEGQRSSQRDPLGRNQDGSRGAIGTDSPLENRDEVYRRAQELMNELRRRSGDGDRPDLERDYLKRLLDQF